MSRKETDHEATRKLVGIARAWYDQMVAGLMPSISLPTRTKQNIAYDDESEVWKYGDRKSIRSAGSAKSALHLLKMSFVIWFLKKQIAENRSSTLRELYYFSEGWKKAKFQAQDESNFLIEDLEILTDMEREAFHLRPEEDGATIFGPLRSVRSPGAGHGTFTARMKSERLATRYPRTWKISSSCPMMHDS